MKKGIAVHVVSPDGTGQPMLAFEYDESLDDIETHLLKARQTATDSDQIQEINEALAKVHEERARQMSDSFKSFLQHLAF